MTKNNSQTRIPKIQEGDFYKVINQAIAEKRHTSYLKRVIKDYEEYKNELESSFSKDNQTDDIYLFRASYLLKQPVWRDIEIHGEQTFEELADVLISSMGWMNDHCHGFDLPKYDSNNKRFFPMRYTFYNDGWEDDPHPTFKSNQIRICDIDYKKNSKLRFMFDFGDGHEFDIEFKKNRKTTNKESIKNFPQIIDQRGIGPEQYPNY